MLHKITALNLSAVDPALGRLDAHSLSDQTLMELLVDGMAENDKSSYQDANGNYTDISTWPLVALQNDRVVQIAFCEKKMVKNQFPFALIPPNVAQLIIEGCSAHGTLDTSVLPRKLDSINVGQNFLHGEIDFSAFPRGLREIIVCFNQFSGSCALHDLPDALVHFNAAGNQFSGEITLNDLPLALEKLCLNRNKLSGRINIDRLPAPMRILDLSGNKFSGNFRMMVYPPGLRCVRIENNPDLSGTAVLRSSTKKLHITLKMDWPKAVVDENGDASPWTEEIEKMHR